MFKDFSWSEAGGAAVMGGALTWLQTNPVPQVNIPGLREWFSALVLAGDLLVADHMSDGWAQFSGGASAVAVGRLTQWALENSVFQSYFRPTVSIPVSSSSGSSSGSSTSSSTATTTGARAYGVAPAASYGGGYGSASPSLSQSF